MIDRGSGPPILLIPGIQGRWEWMRPAVDAMAVKTRVITDSLPGERDSIARADTDRDFDIFVDWIDQLVVNAGLESVSLCGVSYGGWIALRYAAVRPERVRSLTLVSTPSPTWQPPCRVERYLRAPRLMAPVFALSSPLRLYPEIAAAFPSLWARAQFGMRYLGRVVAAPMSPTLMAARVHLANAVDFTADCAHIVAPTQIVTGTPELDRVVAVESTRQYLARISGSRADQIPRTGHIGLVTRPDHFASIVTGFARGAATAADRKVRVPA